MGDLALRLRWWREVLYIGVFYALYTAVRNTQGSAAVSARRAFANAERLIHLERLLGIFHEGRVQDWFLGLRPFIGFWNMFYGSAHFAVTAAALVWMFRRTPWRYPRWRNILACTTALALIGFALYPLMPPRLLPPSYGFVDTLRTIGGLWSFDSGAMQKISNPFAAMPSLHTAWASWCSFALWPGVRRLWSRALVITYPLLTVFGIVVTANHFILDAVAGLATLSAGVVVGSAVTSITWGTHESRLREQVAT